MTREETVNRLLDVYRRSYDLHQEDVYPEGTMDGLVARCEYYELNEAYAISRKANLWSASREEFLYLVSVDHLTEGLYQKLQEDILQDGMGRLNIGPGHMSSYITAVIVCDDRDEAAAAALKKSRAHKSFKFSLQGWMDYRAVMINSNTKEVITNGAGKPQVKLLKKVLS